MAEETNDSKLVRAVVAQGSDPKLYELIFNLVQEAQAAGSVVQIITIWPATEEGKSPGPGPRPTKCAPTGACPK